MITISYNNQLLNIFLLSHMAENYKYFHSDMEAHNMSHKLTKSDISLKYDVKF